MFKHLLLFRKETIVLGIHGCTITMQQKVLSKAHQRLYNEKKSYDYDHDDNANTNIAYWENLSNNRLDISRKPELTICSW